MRVEMRVALVWGTTWLGTPLQLEVFVFWPPHASRHADGCVACTIEPKTLEWHSRETTLSTDTVRQVQLSPVWPGRSQAPISCDEYQYAGTVEPLSLVRIADS